MPSALFSVLVAAPFAIGVAVTPDAPQGTTLFSFQDPAIVEASSLVVQDGVFLTANDSGDTGRVFAVDRTGATVGVTHWSDDPTDVEALAPGGPGHVWVGDIGDNLARRSHVTITRIPVGEGERTVSPTSYRLRYPQGAVDAETLIRNPRTGRLYIVDKNVFGGTLYAVPSKPSTQHANRMSRVGRVLPMATDGSFFPDGRHLVLRNYAFAAVYDWPSLERVGAFELPAETQGEGIAAGRNGMLYLSSEGIDAPVVATKVPAKIRRAMATSSTAASPGAASPAQQTSDPSRPADAASHEVWPWAVGGLVAAAAGVVLLRALRPH